MPQTPAGREVQGNIGVHSNHRTVLKQPAKVLVVVSKFAPHAGGTAMVWTEWCKHWPADQLVVIAPSIPGSQTTDATLPYKVIRVPYPDIPKLRMPLLWFLLGLRALWESLHQRPRLIHFQHVFENASWGPIFRALLGVPYWVHVYGEELAFCRRFPLLSKWVGYVLARAQGVTTISDYSLGLLRSLGYSGKCMIVHPGVDTTAFSPGPPGGWLDRAGVPAGPTLLTMGRLMERKGQDMVIAALPNLVQRFPGLNYVIAGTGPDETRLRSLVARLGLAERVHFLGRLDDADIPLLMRECTLFVHPNRITATGDVEGFGIVFLEASACALPVVGGRTGGTPDSVAHGLSGYLINPQDPDELQSVLTRLLEDPDLRRTLGEGGRNFAQSFSWAGAAGRVWQASLATG